jgi:chemotaxis protein methyltransferase CheR
MTQDSYLLLNELISERLGIEFPEHRKEVLEARLRPHIESLRLPGFWEYYLHLRADTNGERHRLAELVTNNETYFFRETRQLDCFLAEALPDLKPAGGTPRVLCAGCSSGEEPYTLGILAGERGRGNGRLLPSLSVDAFDVDQRRVEAARRAEYGPGSLRLLKPDQVERYFEALGADRWSLREPFRGGVRFAWGNIMDPGTFPAGALYDAVFCRNVLIYFSPQTLHRAVRHFAQVLRPGGLLFLGAAESIIGLSDRFETVRLSGTIAYRRKGGTA